MPNTKNSMAYHARCELKDVQSRGAGIKLIRAQIRDYWTAFGNQAGNGLA